MAVPLTPQLCWPLTGRVLVSSEQEEASPSEVEEPSHVTLVRCAREAIEEGSVDDDFLVSALRTSKWKSARQCLAAAHVRGLWAVQHGFARHADLNIS